MRQEVEDAARRIADGESFYRNPCFYVYDLGIVGSKLDHLQEHLPGNVSLYYAMKANPTRQILSTMRGHPYVKGIEIASLGEYERAREFFEPDEIIFTGPGKIPFELQRVVKDRIRLLNIESLTEASRVSQIAGESKVGDVDVLVRLNVDYKHADAHTHMAGTSSKFGIDESKIEEVFPMISDLRGLRLRGFHVFSGSGVLDYIGLTRYTDYVFGLVSRLERVLGTQSDIIDFGGGFGIDYSGKGRKLNISKFGIELERLIDQYGYFGKELILELGRYVVGESGHYVTEIVDIKESGGKKHIITAGGINHQRRPCATEMNHPVSIVPMMRPKVYKNQHYVDDETVDIGGPLCLSADILGVGIHIPHAEIGDLVSVGQSGAYGLSMAAINFLSHPIAPEYFIDRNGNLMNAED